VGGVEVWDGYVAGRRGGVVEGDRERFAAGDPDAALDTSGKADDAGLKNGLKLAAQLELRVAGDVDAVEQILDLVGGIGKELPHPAGVVADLEVQVDVDRGVVADLEEAKDRESLARTGREVEVAGELEQGHVLAQDQREDALDRVVQDGEAEVEAIGQAVHKGDGVLGEV